MFEIQGKYNKAMVYAGAVEPSAYAQILQLCNLEAFADTQIAIMPDNHAGKGCVIGFTSTMNGRVVPNLIGVDIGCGMEVVTLGDIDIDFKALDTFIRKHIPHGSGINQKEYPERQIPNSILYQLQQISDKTNTNLPRHLRAIGSLGGGNHFIEINVDENNIKYLVIHSGSRNLGKQVATYHQKRAEEHVRHSINRLQQRMKEELKALNETRTDDNHHNNQINVKIQTTIEKYQNQMQVYKVPKELSFLEDDGKDQYLNDMETAQTFADMNRKEMAKRITDFLGVTTPDQFTSVHNYIDISIENAMIRKGATSAKDGEKLIIPINMRDGSIIAIGKGNKEWNQSAPHGAGRRMSRSEAKTTLNLNDFQNTMQSVWTTSIGESTLDEAPMAYKTMTDITDYTDDTMTIVAIIKPLYNFKSSS